MRNLAYTVATSVAGAIGAILAAVAMPVSGRPVYRARPTCRIHFKSPEHEAIFIAYQYAGGRAICEWPLKTLEPRSQSRKTKAKSRKPRAQSF